MAAIVDSLQAADPETPRERLETDVQAFLSALLARGLIRIDTESAP